MRSLLPTCGRAGRGSAGGAPPAAPSQPRAHMLRALVRAPRLARPRGPLPARRCASAAAARDPEIQVRALEGPDTGECALRAPGSTPGAGGLGGPGPSSGRGAGRCGPAQAVPTERLRPEGRRIYFRMCTPTPCVLV